ncbi:MAG TPA: hypothetical protein VJ749_15300 [Pyrinomonadaceae bacterium]|jgi:hypothetical protein|nr:hypothetical protein [Pyrinomonadaceae bacterium]
MSISTTSTQIIPQRPLNRYSVLDNEQIRGLAVNSLEPETWTRQLGLQRSLAEQIVELATTTATPIAALATVAGLELPERERIRRLGIFGQDPRLAIIDVEPVSGRVMSDKAFALRVHFIGSSVHPPRLVSIRVEWPGDPFVTEQLIGPAELKAGYVDVQFGEDQTLPPCVATFRAKTSVESVKAHASLLDDQSRAAVTDILAQAGKVKSHR